MNLTRTDGGRDARGWSKVLQVIACILLAAAFLGGLHAISKTISLWWSIPGALGFAAVGSIAAFRTFPFPIGLGNGRHDRMPSGDKDGAASQPASSGNGSTPSTTPEDWLAAAAEKGHSEASFHLGLRYLSQGEVDKARQAWQDAGKKHTEARFNLGLLARNAPAANTNQPRASLTEAEKWFSEAADAGHLEAKFQLGLLILQDPNRLAEANDLLTEAADEGHIEAQFYLGAPEANTTSIDRLERAAGDGHREAQFQLGLVRRRQGDIAKAEQLWQSAGGGGHVGAMFYLGLSLRQRGETSEALSWLRGASEKGHTDAMFNLGQVLREQGTPDARGEAQEVLLRAAREGHVEAMFALAAMRANQPGTSPW